MGRAFPCGPLLPSCLPARSAPAARVPRRQNWSCQQVYQSKEFHPLVFSIMESMKKIIFGIFAHPDDEAFGPAGTLINEVQNGAELHLISFTAGDAGTNLDNAPDLGVVREEEWRKAGALIGATSMHLLGYKDGHLDNQSMIEATDRISQIVHAVIDNIPHDAVVEFMTLDLNGYTGHIDHIVAARTACQVFYRLK